MKSNILSLVILSAVIVACDSALLGPQDAVISLSENLQSPPLLTDGWDVSDLETENIKPGPIQELIKYTQNDPQNIHSLIIVRHNKLVAECYFDGWHRDRMHALRSTSKSFVSTLVGIAIDRGEIKSDNEKVFNFFPEYADLNNEKKNQIEIRHILTMTPGLQWDEFTYYDQDDYRNDEYAIEQQSDRLGYLFNKELIYTPGSTFVYNSAMPVLQSALIKKATGNNVDVYAKENLFKPLGITDYYWRMNPDGYVAIAPLFLKPRDMAKLGQLFLDSGRWKGNQIVSSNWVAKASSTIVQRAGIPGIYRSGTGYGYNWWTEQFIVNKEVIQAFAAEGSGGQYIFVVPKLDAVVVFTGGNYKEPQNRPFGMMANSILPAMF
ncbi:MAG TPA: serine hydrolase [Cyclobacteriaceae bacterium]|jgi:CubicO group peptidase (beta-lactamase class C family)|nr:serine hydrolase [Cyclobacteriaceae bacterium]